MFESGMKSYRKSFEVRKRIVKKKKEEEVARAAPRDERSKVLRLLAFVLVSVAAVGATGYVIGQEWEAGHRATSQDCAVMKDIDQAVRSLGLDDLPGYIETCFSVSERLQTAAQPFTGPAADLLQEVIRRLRLGARRLMRIVTFVPRVTYKAVISVTRRLVDTLVTEVNEEKVDMESEVTNYAQDYIHEEVPTEESEEPEELEEPKEPEELEETEETEGLDDSDEPDELEKPKETEETEELEELEYSDQPEELEDPEESALPEGGSTDEGDIVVPKESKPVRQSEDDAAFVLTREDLKVLFMHMAAIFGKEVDEGSLDALVQSIGSRRLSEAAPAGKE